MLSLYPYEFRSDLMTVPHCFRSNVINELPKHIANYWYSEAEDTIGIGSFIGSQLVHAYCHISWNSEDGWQRLNITCIFFDLILHKHLNTAFYLSRFQGPGKVWGSLSGFVVVED